MNRGHAERFCVGVLEIIEASKSRAARGRSVDEVGALGVLRTRLRVPPIVDVESGIEGKVVVKMSTAAVQF
jgi:hypothetical protein